MKQNLGLDRILSNYEYQNIFIKAIRLFPFLVEAYLKPQISPENVPYYLNSVQGGGSIKLKLHIAQIIAKNSFQMYDYGKLENINKYGFKIPLAYNYTVIEIPLFIVYAKDDKFVNPKDIDMFCLKLKGRATLLGKLMVTQSGFNSNGYLFGNDAKKLVYDEILGKFEKATAESPGSNFNGLLQGK